MKLVAVALVLAAGVSFLLFVTAVAFALLVPLENLETAEVGWLEAAVVIVLVTQGLPLLEGA